MYDAKIRPLSLNTSIFIFRLSFKNMRGVFLPSAKSVFTLQMTNMIFSLFLYDNVYQRTQYYSAGQKSRTLNVINFL